jgi:hypothetical protein
MKPVQLDEGNVNGATKERARAATSRSKSVPSTSAGRYLAAPSTIHERRVLEHAGAGRLGRDSWLWIAMPRAPTSVATLRKLDVVDVDAGPHIRVLQDRQKASSWTSLTRKSDLT